jgi:hypothetical protein
LVHYYATAGVKPSPGSSATDTASGGSAGSTPVNRLVDNFVLPLAEIYKFIFNDSVIAAAMSAPSLPLSSAGQIGGIATKNFTFVISSRLTTYKMLPPNSKAVADANPLTFAYFEDSDKFKRCFVRTDFLGAAFHKTLHVHIAQTQSSKVIYDRLVISSFEKKEWQNNGSFCQKGELNKFSSTEGVFSLLRVGQSPIEEVNYNSQLMFTSQFEPGSGTFYRTNRYITCSVFTSQADVAKPKFAALFAVLKQAYVETIVLSRTPSIVLRPCFGRGTVLEIATEVFFKGIVSNSGSS